MSTSKLTSEQWSKILDFLKERTGVYVKSEQECKRFIEGVLWMSRSGAPWRMLPAGYGKWYSVYRRFSRWNEQGIWEKMHQHFADEPDMEHLIIAARRCARIPVRRVRRIKRGTMVAGSW